MRTKIRQSHVAAKRTTDQKPPKPQARETTPTDGELPNLRLGKRADRRELNQQSIRSPYPITLFYTVIFLGAERRLVEWGWFMVGRPVKRATWRVSQSGRG